MKTDKFIIIYEIKDLELPDRIVNAGINFQRFKTKTEMITFANKNIDVDFNILFAGEIAKEYNKVTKYQFEEKVII
jgi:hypothetical protein